MLTHPKRLPIVISGACDGVIKAWNVTTKESLSSVQAHTGFVRGMGINQAGDLLLSVGDDQIVRMWNVDDMLKSATVNPTTTITSKVRFCLQNLSNL